MLNHRLSSAVFLHTEADGTLVYRKNGKILRVTRAVAKPGELTGFYPPGGRRALYKGAKDQRNTAWFAEAVRDRRRQGFEAGVKPGPQSL